MQQGIGRAGYLLLALAAFGFGLLGLALTWVAYGAAEPMFFEIGLGVAALGMLLLFMFAASGSRASSPRPARAPKAAPPAAPSPPAPEPAKPQGGLDFEFKDYQPAPRAAPTELVVPQAFQESRQPAPPQAMVDFQPRSPTRDPAAWPEQRGKSAWTVQQEHRRKVQDEIDDSVRRQEFVARYTTGAPTMRNILQKAPPAPGVPEQMAERAPRDMNTDFVAPGMSVGRCGQCHTLLLAPETRPLRLKCPECAKLTLLE